MGTLKKNQIIVFVMALMLITAGYFNYNTKNKETEASANVLVEEIAEVGEAKLVNASETTENENTNEISKENMNNTTTNESEQVVTSGTDEYFSSSRLGRDTMYSQMIESYQKIINNEGISQEQKAVATKEITKINETKNSIMIAENLIKTKGLDDVVIFVNDKSISVILKCEKLEEDKIAQVQNIVARELDADIDDIHISNKQK